jgi:hypothetical protein
LIILIIVGEGYKSVSNLQKVISINDKESQIKRVCVVSINNKKKHTKGREVTLWQAGTTINENFTMWLTVNNRDPTHKGINPL